MVVDPGTDTLNSLMNSLGRASTPVVPPAPYGLSLGRLTKRRDIFRQQDVDVVGFLSNELNKVLEEAEFTVVGFAPGDVPEDLPNDATWVCVVDRRAFFDGPWAGGLSSNGVNLREIAYALQVFCRQNGIPVWFVDDEAEDTFSVVRLKSVSDVVLPEVNEEDFEEEAPALKLFEMLDQIARVRFGKEVLC